MKIFLLSDRSDTLSGMRLAGIEGRLIKSADELKNFVSTYNFENVAIILITKKLCQMDKEFVYEMKKKNMPLVVEVPDADDCEKESDSINGYIRDAMGIKI